MKALIVDGYNIVYAHPVLSTLMDRDPDSAREGLLRELSSLVAPAFYDVVMVVFDAAGSSQAEPVIEDRGGMKVVFTRRRQSADSFIEGVVRHLVQDNQVVVATSDRMLMNLARGFGATSVDGESLLAAAGEAISETREEMEKAAGSRRSPLEDRVSEEIRELLDRMRYG